MPIPLVWSDDHIDHAPSLQTVEGQTYPHPERPERAGLIRDALVGARLVDLAGAEPHADRTIDAVHAAEYRRFIRATCEQIPAGRQLTPAGGSRDPRVLTSDRLEERISFYAFGADAPLMRGTYRAARCAVDVALTGADLVADGTAQVFALCRPPGHHAEFARMGGFCYFDNAVIAAQRLVATGTVAILDIDYHHGNGSQHLTYARDDILYLSLHADPSYAYPGFSGRVDETGEGAGQGFNHNFPLPAHTGIDVYAETLDRACEIVARFQPSSLVVSIGFDTHEEDPIAIMRLRSEDFGCLAARIAQLALPTLHVLEGGYALERLGESAVAYMDGLGA